MRGRAPVGKAHTRHRTPPCVSIAHSRMASGLVVIGGIESARADCGDYGLLVGVALAGDEALDCADGHALVSDGVVIAPRRQDREPPPERVGRIDARVPADLFVHDQVEAAGLVEVTASEFCRSSKNEAHRRENDNSDGDCHSVTILSVDRTATC